MAADYAKLIAELRDFYDFTGKTVLFVGAGGGQLLDPAVRPKKLIAIDSDANGLAELKNRVVAKGMQEYVELVCAKFEDVTLSRNVVYFEFCLHEIADPYQALAHARQLAPDIVVFDHAPGSQWAFHAAEEDKVSLSSAAMARFGIRRSETFQTPQRFRDHAELLAKVSAQGPLAVERAQRYASATDIAIPMDYALTLL